VLDRCRARRRTAACRPRGDDGGDAVTESTLYQDAYNDIGSPTYTTSHSVTVNLDLPSGDHMKFQPRGFTASGASGTTQPWMGHVYC
jgi:hypothetical protein